MLLPDASVKIRIMSDLHVEFFDFVPAPVQADVVVLAGDILNEHRGLEWARRTFPDTPIVYVLGNHEFYGADYEAVLDRSRREASRLSVHLLECDEVVLNGVRFLGATLWTDFETAEATNTDPAFAMWYARHGMSDFSVIRYRGGRLSPEATREFHLHTRSWLKSKLAAPFDGKTIVVTHHLPHRDSIDPQFHRDPLNPAFASHMPDLVRQPVTLWVHGHTHCSCDYVAEGTRVVCNPRGYGPDELNPKFDPMLVVDM
jgi:predicted phosphodiesterase